ncbi:hypothetical protein D3C72_1265060 [compost metagenome]
MLPTRLNLPPAKEVPPKVTARMASSSSIRPALFASALLMFELIIRPDRPAQAAQKT